MFPPDRARQLIEAALPDCTAVVESDDGEHFQARVVSSAFVGKHLPAQHRMVYAALGEIVGREMHALALRTFTPEQWQG